MDLKTPYELIIAEKLQNIPVPDMADQIWSRVKFQLDIDMPADDGIDPPDGGGAPTFPRFYPGGIGLVILAVVLTLFYTGSFDKKQEIKSPVIVPEKAPGEEIESGRQGANNEKDNLSTPSSVARYRESPPGSPPARDSVSLTTNEPPLNLVKDSLVSSPAQGIIPVLSNEFPSVANTDTIPLIPKKKRGVSGITENDYRIVPKKNEQQP